MIRLNDRTQGNNGHLAGPAPASAQEDGYWEALLVQGEVAGQADPPPWVGNGQQDASGMEEYHSAEDQSDWQRAEHPAEPQERSA